VKQRHVLDKTRHTKLENTIEAIRRDC